MLEIPAWLAYAGGIGLVLGVFITRYREGTDKAESQALSLAKQTVDFLKEKVNALEENLNTNTVELARLQSENERLALENQKLTDLVMGNQVPTALQEFLKQMHDDTLERIAASETNMVKALGSMTRAFSDDLRNALARPWDGETERRQA